jgi:hypothetical protein
MMMIMMILMMFMITVMKLSSNLSFKPVIACTLIISSSFQVLMARVSLIGSSGSGSSTLNTLIRLESQPLPLSSAAATAAIAALLNMTADIAASSLNSTLTHMHTDFLSSHVAAGAAQHHHAIQSMQ